MPVAEVEGFELAYELVGEDGAQPWVLTPGGRFTKEVGGLPELARALADQGRRVLTWDRPNCGASSVEFRGRSESEVQAEALGALSDLSDDDLVDLRRVASSVHLSDGPPDLDESMSPRRYRLLSRIPRLPETVVESIVDRFGDLQKVLRATIDELDDVSGVGKLRARAVKDGLSRLAEASILDRYS